MKYFFNDIVLRNIFKYLYRISHTKSFHHNRRYWPYFRVERDEQGFLKKVYFKNTLIADNRLPATPSNHTCMIVATGPSIREMDAKFLQKDTIDYIGVNGAINLAQTPFKYYVIIDFDFVNNRFDLVLEVLQAPDCILFTTAHCLEIILRKQNLENIKCTFKVIEVITEGKLKTFMGKKRSVDEHQPHSYLKEGIGFSTEIFNAVYDYYTVAYVVLQIAYALNYKKILIAGLDMSQFHQPRFYESVENKQPTRLDQDFIAISHALNIASDFFKTYNVEVYNLSINSAVEAFSKAQPYQVISDEL